jgi:hypothetical protein
LEVVTYKSKFEREFLVDFLCSRPSHYCTLSDDDDDDDDDDNEGMERLFSLPADQNSFVFLISSVFSVSNSRATRGGESSLETFVTSACATAKHMKTPNKISV